MEWEIPLEILLNSKDIKNRSAPYQSTLLNVALGKQ